MKPVLLREELVTKLSSKYISNLAIYLYIKYYIIFILYIYIYIYIYYIYIDR